LSWLRKLFSPAVDVETAAAAARRVLSGHVSSILYHLETARAAIVEQIPFDGIVGQKVVTRLTEKVNTQTKRIGGMFSSIQGRGVKVLDAILARLK